MQHPLPLDRLAGLADPERGLTAEDARARRERFGLNDVVEVPENPLRAVLRDTIRDPMLWFLVGTSFVYAILGEFAEAIVLVISIVPLAGMDAFLHRRTSASTEGLRSRLASRARVVRDGVEVDLPVSDVVPGDLARVVAGDSFPADGLVVVAVDARVDESALTGESFPVHKVAPAAWPDTTTHEVRVEAESCGFAGTRLLTGRVSLRVASTGKETLYGEIVRSAVQGSHVRTPLQTSIAGLVRVLLVTAAVMCAALATTRWLQGHGPVDALVSAMTLAVAALPEEFPVVFTLFLGVGVHRLARHKALVRRAVSVENIGRVTTICSDKTGTITEGRLDLTHVIPAAGGSRERTLGMASHASSSGTGDPLDVAVRALAEREALVDDAWEVIERFPFTEDRKRETVVLARGDELLVATKGSPEVVSARSLLDSTAAVEWERRVTDLAREGHKVIAVASLRTSRATWVGGEPDRGFTFDGCLAFEDPARAGVREAVLECRASGIHVIVVTGDHPATATAIARDIGLCDVPSREAPSRDIRPRRVEPLDTDSRRDVEARASIPGEPRVVLGADLQALVDRDPRELAHVDVVARAVPSQKLILVRALQASGEIVAVTGDGVNDVPALQAADVGIAMGERGTRSAREIASIVLLDDDFATIVRAIAEGRQLFRNLQASFRYLLMIHLPLVVTAALIPLVGFPILYLPVHVVWMELLIHPSAMLVFQDLPPDGKLSRDGRLRAGAFFSSTDVWTIVLVGAFVGAWVVFLYRYAIDTGTVEHARAVSLATMSFASAAFVVALAGLRTSVSRWITGGTIALAVVLIQTPITSTYLHLEPLHADDWALATVGPLVAYVAIAVTSWWARRRAGGTRPLASGLAPR